MLQKVVRGDGTFILWESGHFILWESDHLSSGNRTTYSLGIGTFPGKRDILSSGNDFILWESGHLSSGNRTTYPLGFGTSSGKRDMGNGTLYPLGIGPLILWETGNSILWESGKGESVFNPSGKHPLGIGNLGDEVQPFLRYRFISLINVHRL